MAPEQTDDEFFIMKNLSDNRDRYIQQSANTKYGKAAELPKQILVPSTAKLLRSIIFGSLVALSACTQSVPGDREFVCYDDGKLTERHVGVSTRSYRDDGTWVIYYVDSDEPGRYRQPEGETCMIEVIIGVEK
jgi:hypothetical protein